MLHKLIVQETEIYRYEYINVGRVVKRQTSSSQRRLFVYKLKYNDLDISTRIVWA